MRDRRLGYKFRRQLPVGPYIADFACPEAGLIVEVDGGQHCENEADLRRTAILNGHGWQVIRFWNNEVLQQTEVVTEVLIRALREAIVARSRPSP